MSLLGFDRALVGRVVVDKTEAKCLHCAEPFKFGVNVFTRDGAAEVRISGVCEKCFDELFEDEE